MEDGEVLPRVTRTIRRFQMLARGDRILTAVSGGPDSVALLHVLLALRPAYALALHVVHVNHNLRPEAPEDAEFVCGLAGSVGVPSTIVEVTETPPAGDSVEAWARRVRYRALYEVARSVGADRIALGHTADDQAETVLMRVLQGAGVRGLAGIPPARGPFIRPLIEIRREAVLSFLKGVGAHWVEDRSNEDPRFLRNRLRQHLLRDLRCYNPAVDSALVRVGQHSGEAWEALAVLGKAVKDASADDKCFRLGAGVSQPMAVLKEAVRQWVEGLTGRPLREAHLEGLSRLVRSVQSAGAVRLPAGGMVEREGSDLVFSRRVSLRVAAEPPGRTASAIPLQIPGRTELPGSDVVVAARVCPREMVTLARDAWSVAFDWEALDRPLEIRFRRPGDHLRPFGFDGTKSLKKLLLEAGVPQKDRDRIPIVTARGEIVWVVGHRRGASAPVGDGSREILLLQARGVADRGAEGDR